MEKSRKRDRSVESASFYAEHDYRMIRSFYYDQLKKIGFKTKDKEIKKKDVTLKKIDKKHINGIIEAMNEAILKEVLAGNEVSLPYGLGKLYVIRKKNIANAGGKFRFAFKITKQDDGTLKYSNELWGNQHTDGYYMHYVWDNRNYKNGYHYKFFRFCPSIPVKRRLFNVIMSEKNAYKRFRQHKR